MSNIKKALVLSGGGARGSWQAGAIKKLIQEGNKYDGYFGVSVGAMNAAHMAQYSDEENDTAIKELEKLWHNFSEKDIFKHHNKFFRWLLVPWKTSVYDTTPLRKYIENNISKEKIQGSGKALKLGITNMSTGRYILRDGMSKDVHEWIYASAAFPVMFEMGRLPETGDYLTDGGAVHITPLRSAIDSGAEEIDVIALDPPGMSEWKVSKKRFWEPKILDPATRLLDIIFDNIIERDLKECMKVNKRVLDGRQDEGHRFIKLRVFRPDSAIPVGSLEFDPKKMAVSFDLGFKHIEKELLNESNKS